MSCRRSTSLILNLAGCIAMSFSTSSCVENDTSLYVEAVLAPDPPDCQYTADPGATQLFRGYLDVALKADYEAVVLVANQMAPRGDKQQLRSETMGVELRGAEIRLTTARGEVVEEFSVPAGGFVHANESDDPGYGAALITLIPAGRGASLADQLRDDPGNPRLLVSNIRVFGTTLGGLDVTSGEFRFPIQVCYGCLIYYPLEALVDSGDGPQCLGDGDVSTTQCFPGQDGAVDCRSCAGQLELCLSPQTL